MGDLVRATGLQQSNVSNHLARLRREGLVQCRRQGRRSIYRIASAGLAHFVLSHGEVDPDATVSVEEVAGRFLVALLSQREEDAVRVADAALAAGISWQALYLDVFTPALRGVGEMWERGEVSVAAEHLMAGIVERLLHRLSLSLPAAPTPEAPSALVACVEGELHTLGSRMLADFLIAAGWRVWYLDGFLPLEPLLEAVERHRPDAVALSLATHQCGAALARARERLVQWRGERPLPLLVAGGRYYQEGGTRAGLEIEGGEIPAVVTEMTRRVAAMGRPPGGEGAARRQG